MIKVYKDVDGIKGLTLIQPKRFYDERGHFSETYNENEFNEINELELPHFVQDNESWSCKGVLRGLHFQKEFPQGKLVRVSRGTIYDVAVDIRRDSETFGKFFGIQLDHKQGLQLYIPEGFAHGFLTLSDYALVNYKCTEYYHPDDQYCIRWNDQTLKISWPNVFYNQVVHDYQFNDSGNLIDLKVSYKDKNGQLFSFLKRGSNER